MFFNIKFSIVFILSAFYVYVGTAQVVKGKVLGLNNNILINANVILIDSINNVIGTITDEKGFYYLDLPASGKYIMTCSYVGYENKETILTINSSESLQIDCKLSPQIECGFITITEKPYQLGDLTMTQNQYKVMPASFQDPARILIKYPGFSTPNDGANAIIFRGMPPESARWQLFGTDIVNPNHLSNAGTANDLATGNAGGVNALSGSVLDYYHFEANPADVSYADVMSGVSNMKMAPKINSFVDLNLIGLEAGLGLSRGNKNAYASYRYSFVGLLDNLGVNFGNEKIGYQDLSLFADIIKTNNSSLKIFGTVGNSSNIFTAVSRGDSLTRFKDIQNITYKSRMYIGGGQYTYAKDNKYFQSTIAFSARNDQRIENTEDFYADSLGISLASDQNIDENLLSLHQQYIVDHYRSKLTYGLRTNLKDDHRMVNDSDDPVFSVYPYVQYQNKGKLFHYQLGIGTFYDTRSKEWTAEPSLGASYDLSDNLSVNLDYRWSSFQEYSAANLASQNYDRNRIKAHNLQSGIKYERNDLQIRGAVFYHHLWDIATFRLDGMAFPGHFSLFNGGNLGYDQVLGSLNIIPNGNSLARVYGSEIYLENTTRIKGNSMFYSINASVFDSKYSLNETVKSDYNAKYSFGYTANVNLSYKIDFLGKKSKHLIISVSNHIRGAQREQSLVGNLGDAATIYDSQSPYNQTFKPYQRLDFRVVYNRQKPGSRKKHRWSLDIQNLLNRENDGFRYYDPYLKNVILQKQLGLVPVLSYRLEWN